MGTQIPCGKRRWCQFGLKSLLLLTVACAVALAWWRERNLIEQLDKTREELRDYQVGVEYYQLVTRGAAAIDRNDPRQQKTFDSLEWFLLYGPPFLASAQSSEVAQGLGRGPLERSGSRAVLRGHVTSQPAHDRDGDAGVLLPGRGISLP